MVASNGDSKGAFGEGLPLDIVEKGWGLWRRLRLCWGGFGDGFDTFEVEKELLERVDANETNSGDKAGLLEIFLGEIDFAKVGVFGSFNDVDNATDGAYKTVKR